MKQFLLLASLTVLSCLCSNPSSGRNPANISGNDKHQRRYQAESAGCSVPVDGFSLDINDVRARLLDAGDMWWDLNSGFYEVPKGPAGVATTQMPQAIFAGSIWVSALDQGSNLKLAALEYRQNGNSDYYTGPLDNTGNVTLATCNMWDQHFPVWGTQIKGLINLYAAQGDTGTLPLSLISDSLKYWPAMGNPYLGALGYDVSGVLAPFYDANGDGIYDPAHGDYPTLKQSGTASSGGACGQPSTGTCSAYADEMVFWVMNDVGNTHTSSGGSPLGIQVNALAYAFQSSDAVNEMTFYTYNIINKSGAVLNRAYISQWTDVDLGCANNDRVGCDTSRNLAIQYNGFVQGASQSGGVTCDEGSVCPTSETGYGCELPMIGIQMLEGPTDTVINSVTHLPIQRGMSSFCYFTNGSAAATSDPANTSEFRNYQTGFWADGTPMTYGGTGYGNSLAFPYAFPGDPSIASQWSECNTQNAIPIAAGDRRFVQSSGPFTFMPCASEFMSIAVLFVLPPGGVGSNCPSYAMIDSVADQAKALYNGCYAGITPPIPSGIQTISDGGFRVYPNPVSSTLYIADQGSNATGQIMIYDVTGALVGTKSGNTNSIDMSGLDDGIYFIKAGGKTVKIVKE